MVFFFFFVGRGIVCWEFIKHFGKNPFFFWRGLNPMKLHGGEGVGGVVHKVYNPLFSQV